MTPLVTATDPRNRDEVWDRLDLGPNALGFLKRVYSIGLDKYARRLRLLGFSGGESALDAGCGVGQWSFALAGMCSRVYGIDVSEERVQACEQLASAWGVTNVNFLQAPLEKLPFDDRAFDRVICYSVLYQTHYERSLSELSRVTRKDGLVYISTNTVGRFLQHIVNRPNPAADFDPRAYGLRTLWNTVLGRRIGLSPQTGGVVTPKWRLLRLLRQSGFEIVEWAPEGRLQGGTEPFLPERYIGILSSFDVLARKTS